MGFLTDDILKPGIAILVGGAIGLEREAQYKTGIGFLGAGTILREGGCIGGLPSAAQNRTDKNNPS